MSPDKDAPVSVTPWKVEAVRLDASRTRICWQPLAAPGPRPLVELHASDRGPFTRFLRLARLAPDAREVSEAVLELAIEFGPLGLCAEHGWPSDHHQSWTVVEPATELTDAIEVPEECLPERHDPRPRPPVRRTSGRMKQPAGVQFRRAADLWYAEPVGRWHQLACGARAIIETAALLRGNKISVSEENWQLIDPLTGLGPARLASGSPVPPFAEQLPPEHRSEYQQSHAQRLTEQRVALGDTVQQNWLVRGNVSTHLDWTGKKPRLGLGAGDLFGYLAVQLTLNVLARKGLAFCSSCGEPFERTGQMPDPEDAVYCSDFCRAEAAAEAAQRRRYQNREPTPLEPKSPKTRSRPP